MATANERAAGDEAGKAADTGTNGPEGFINKPKVAGRMSKCPRTIDNLMQQGLPHYKVGRSVIFRWSEVEAWLAVNCRVSRRAN
jgi:predicted DNA-binding transcriptional regulator AlpA